MMLKARLRTWRAIAPRDIGRLVGPILLAGTAAVLLAIPRGPGRPSIEALSPQPASAICSPDQLATGWLTQDNTYNQTGSGPVKATDINSATVYAYISILNGTNDGGSSGEKNCGNPVYRYGGLLWLTNTTTATINWGATTANGNSSGCYPVYGTNDYLHANSTTTCVLTTGGNPGINYKVMAISLAPANLTYQNDTALNSSGDFEFVWDSCSTFYQDTSGSGKVVKTGVPKADLDNIVGNTTAISWKPGANCGGALTQDSTGTSQTVDYDTILPTMTSVTNNAGTNSYASSTTATTIWVRSNTSGTVNLTPLGADSLAGIRDYSFLAMGGTTAGWTPTATVTQAGVRTYSWTSSVADGQSSTVELRANDNAGNQSSAGITVTLRGDETAPSAVYTYPAADTYRNGIAAFDITWSESEAGSGIAARSATWQTAPLSSGSCGTISTEAAITPGSSTTTRSAVAQNTCYRLVLTMTDRVGNQGTYTSSWVKVAPNAPAAPTVTSTAPGGSYRTGDTIFFRPAAASTITLTADGDDPVSGIASSAFGALSVPTGWTYTPGIVNGDPASKGLTWSGSAGTASLSITTTNNAGVTSAGRTITFAADSLAPALSFGTPSGFLQQTSTTLAAAFSASDPGDPATGSGVATWTIRLDRLAIATAGTCPATLASPWSPPVLNGTGSVVNQSASYATNVVGGYCYQWVLDSVDRVGNATTAVSFPILVDTTAPTTPGVTDNSPGGSYRTGDTIYFRPSAAGTVTLTSTGTDSESGISGSTYGALTVPTGWTYTSGSVAGNPASKNLTWSAGAGSSGLTVTATNGAGGISAGRSITLTADATSPATSAFFASLTGSDATVSWTETEAGSGIASRALQRLRVGATSAAQCAAATYSPDGSAQNVTSPASAPSLPAGFCYRWTLLVTDRVGNVSTLATSNDLYLAPPLPTLAVTDNLVYATITCTDTTGGGCVTPTWSLPATAAATIYEWTSSVSCPSNGRRVQAWLYLDVAVDFHEHGSTGNGNFVPTVNGYFATAGSGINSQGQGHAQLQNPDSGAGLTSVGCQLTVTVAWGWNGTAWTRPSAWRTGGGSTIYFNNNAPGSFQLTADGSATAGSITSNTFGALAATPTGWTPTSVQTSPTDPYSVTYGWVASAADTSTSITSHNSLGFDSAPVSRNFTADSTAPSIQFVSPASDDFPARGGTSYTVKFNATDSGSGFEPFGSGWRLMRQKATITNGYCNAFANDSVGGSFAYGITSGSNITSAQTLISGSCYRWLLAATDAVGNTSPTITSGPILVNVDPADARAITVSAQPTASIGQAVWIVAGVNFVGSGQPVDSYSGTITASGSGVTFLDGSSATFGGALGDTSHSFRVEFSTTGTKTVNFVGTGGIVGSVQVQVTASSIDAAAPTDAFVGIPIIVKVAAHDANGDLLPAYSGLMTFASSDAGLTYGGGIDSNHQFRMPCSCDNGHPFPMTFSATGTQTITVTDEFGNSDQVSINVAAAPSPIPIPSGLGAYSVEWAYGHTVDYYIDNNSGLALTAVETYSTCAGGNPQRNGSGESLNGRYTSFSVHIAVAECGFAGSQANDGNNVIVTDGSGHKWDIGTTRYYRFSSVPGSSNFTDLDDGDPLAANDVSVVNRTFATSPVPSPEGGGQNFNVATDGLTLQVGAYSSFRITGYSFPNSPFVTFYSVPLGRQGHSVPAGTSNLVLDDIPWGCYFGPRGNGSIAMRYVDAASGRDGRRDFSIGSPPAAPATLCDSPNGGHTYDPVWTEQSGKNMPFTLDMFSAPLFQAVRQAVGDPVDIFSGSQTADVTDVTLGGLTPSLTVRRIYRSVAAQMLWQGKAGAHSQQLLFGAGWTSLFDTNLAFPTPTRVSVRHTDGYYEFDKLTSGAWVASGNTTDVLSAVGGGWKLTHLDGTGFRFDSAGRLAAIFDANGRELVLTWTLGKLTGLADAAGRTAAVTTNAAGEITRLDLPGGRYIAYTYDATGYLHTVRDLAGSVLTYNADPRGRITSVQDSAQHVLLRDVYDNVGRVAAQYDALDHPTFFNYDDLAISGSGFTVPNTTTMTRTTVGPLGATTLSCYNTKGLMIATIGAEGGIKSWTYDGRGNPIRSVDELGYVSKAIFDARREPVSMTDALGHATTMTWDAFGHLASTANASATTAVAFDPTTHLPSTITNTSGANSLQIAAYTYVPGTNLLQTATTQGGATTTYHYDAYGYVDSIIDPAGRKTTFVTDPNTGFVTSSVDPLGYATGGVPGDHTTTYTYDDAGRVLTVTDALGNMAGGNAAAHRTTYSYDGFGRLKTESRASGALTTYNYDLAGQLTSTVVKLTATRNATTTYEYSAAGYLTVVTDPEDRGTQTAYDLVGRPISVTDANNKTSTLEYDAKGRLTRTTDPTGVVLQTTYDALDRITSAIDGANRSTTYGYDPTTGLLTSVTDPLTHATGYGYDWLGRLTSVTNAENKTSSTTYDARGYVASVTNARNKTTSFTNNEVGQLLTVTEPGDSGNLVTTYAYYDDGSLKTRQNARGAVDLYEYNALGQPTKFTDADGKIWQTFYTNDGDIDHTIDGKSQTTTFGRDLAGRLLTVTPTSPTPGVTYTYDDSGRVLTMADGAGTTAYGYDPVGRLSSVLRAGRTTGYTYDNSGRLKTVAYPASQGTVTYAYDTAGRLSTITDWSSRVTTYHYDNASRVASVDRPGGLTTTYTYDNVDRPLTAASVRAGNTVLSQAWTYDANGNIATLTDDTGAASFTYDNLDRLLTASYPASQNYSYTYDAVGNITQAVTPTGTATYTYDLGDRITSNGPAGSPQAGTTTRAPSANNAGWTNSGSGYASDDTYATASPAKNQTTSFRLGTFGLDGQIPANATITNVTVSVEWKVDTASSIATLGSQVYVGGTARGSELVNSAEPVGDAIQTYAVSGLTRADLVDGAFEVQVRASRGNSNTAFTASLDAVSVQVDYTIPGPPAAAPTYDNNGNMTSDGSYGNRTYAYDTLGRLASVTSGGATTTYSLDGSGNRWSQTTGAATTSFDLDLLGSNPTILGDGTAKYLPGSPGSGNEASGTWRNAITDLLGSPVLLVDTAGATSGLTHYDPYGVPRPGSTATTGIGYAGEYRDGTGLVNLRARSYDPVLGRFIGRDTYGGVASAPQTGNRYAYATANPLRYRDPSGHFVQTIIEHPALLVEFAAYLNPLTATILTAEKLLTGHDPATGEVVDPKEALGDFALFVAVPVVAKFLSKAFSGIWSGLGEEAGLARTIGRAEGESAAIGERIGGDAAAEVGSPAHLVAGRTFETRQLEELALAKNTEVFRPSAAQMDGASFRLIVGEPKFTPGGQPVGVITDGVGLEIKGGTSTLGSSYQLRLMTYRALVENEPLTILTTRPVGPSFLDWLTRWGVTVKSP